MRHGFRPNDRLEAAERVQRNHAPGPVADIELAEVGRRGARFCVGLHCNAERMAEQVEVVHIERAEIDLQRIEYVREAEAEELRLRPVEVIEELRRRGGERGEQ